MLRNLFFVFMIMLILTACPNRIVEEKVVQENTAEEKKEEPPLTIEFEEHAPGSRQYYTNDRSKAGFYHIHWFGKSQTPFVSAQSKVQKKSGSSQAFYGVIFCRQENSGYYAFMINTNGYYTILKFEKYKKTVLVQSTKSILIKKGSHNGYQIDNHLQVKALSRGQFTCLINDQKLCDFSDTTAPLLETGYSGYILEIKSNEDPSLVAVDVRFTEE